MSTYKSDTIFHAIIFTDSWFTKRKLLPRIVFKIALSLDKFLKSLFAKMLKRIWDCSCMEDADYHLLTYLSFKNHEALCKHQLFLRKFENKIEKKKEGFRYGMLSLPFGGFLLETLELEKKLPGIFCLNYRERLF